MFSVPGILDDVVVLEDNVNESSASGVSGAVPATAPSEFAI